MRVVQKCACGRFDHSVGARFLTSRALRSLSATVLSPANTSRSASRSVFTFALTVTLTVTLTVFLTASTPAHSQELFFGSQQNLPTSWQENEKGFLLRRYEFPSDSSVLRAEVILARFDPALFSFHVAVAPKGERTSITHLTDQLEGIAGINASFFDKAGLPLGLLVVDRIERQRLQLGGSLLTGVFFTDGEHPAIRHRTELGALSAVNAVQAGPRLIVGGKPLELSAPLAVSRRSGVAITSTGEVVLYSTVLRFPGTSLHQIQQMLLDPHLGVTVVDALNLDGGGSSQLYIKPRDSQPISITGGDAVPVGIVVKRRGSAHQG